MEIGLEAGADDVRRSGDNFEVLCAPEAYEAVAKALEQAGIQPDVSEISRMPKNTVDVTDPEVARKVLKLMNRLDDHDDVQNVSSNFNIPEAIMAQVGDE